MLTPRQKYEVCRVKSGVALIPIINTITMGISISTRTGNGNINWGDGSNQNVTFPKNVDYTTTGIATVGFNKTYSSAFTGDITVKVNNGLRDVYSIYFGGYIQDNDKKLNIQNFGIFINQFPNLYSIGLQYYCYGNNQRKPIIKGDLADIPDSVERYRLYDFEITNGTTDLWFNFSTLRPTSKLKYFQLLNTSSLASTTLKLIGDLSKLPQECNFFSVVTSPATSSITYTAGKVWASAFDTLSIPLALTTPELDNLLIDMNNSITTKIGAGIISLGGLRSSTSDAAVASLEAKGFTVNVSRRSQILNLPFQNSFADSGEIGMTMVAGGTSNQPTFALSGRKAGEYCAVFNGSQSLKTTTNLPVNSDKVTVAFWMKTTQTGVAIVGEMSPNTNSNNTFSWYINDAVANSVQFNSRNTGYNQSARTGANNGTWKHFVAVIDRAQNAANEILIYENGTLTAYTKPNSFDNNGNFVNNILFIGQRGGSSFGFNGSLTRLKIYNYPLTAGEVSTLYNSEV